MRPCSCRSAARCPESPPFRLGLGLHPPATVQEPSAGRRPTAPYEHRAGVCGGCERAAALLRHAVDRRQDPGQRDPGDGSGGSRKGLGREPRRRRADRRLGHRQGRGPAPIERPPAMQNSRMHAGAEAAAKAAAQNHDRSFDTDTVPFTGLRSSDRKTGRLAFYNTAAAWRASGRAARACASDGGHSSRYKARQPAARPARQAVDHRLWPGRNFMPRQGSRSPATCRARSVI